MSGVVSGLLSARGQAASDVLHAILFKAVLGNQAGLVPGPFQPPDEDRPWLGSLSAHQLVRESTPFCWLNLRRLAKVNDSKEASALDYARHFAMTSFDAYFDLAPDGTKVMLRGRHGFPDVFLPRLGIQVTTGCCDSVLIRRSSTTITIDSSNTHLCLNLRALEPITRLRAIPIPLFPSSQLLFVRDLALFDSQYIDEIADEDTTAVTFTRAISNALGIIARVDGELQSRIAGGIRWYVPIRSPSPEIHCSFTSAELKGVTFLSYTENQFVLAEAIVHEFGHTELNILMDTEAVTCEEPGERFYSPWRTDARPLSGLIHALYVFSGVAEFLARAADSPEVAKHIPDLEAQRITIYHRLRVGLKQVPREKLTPVGNEIIEDIEGRLRLQEDHLEDRARRTPAWIHDHLLEWKAKNPELETVVRMP